MDKLLRWLTLIFFLLFVAVTVYLYVHLSARDKVLGDYLREEAPLLRARHQEVCKAVDSLLTVNHIVLPTSEWRGCEMIAEVPKDPEPRP